MKEALQYTHLSDRQVQCSLCNHRCKIQDGGRGICGIRRNEGGTLFSDTYGKISGEALDPVEKKPLYHFLPGSLCYSLGSIGCNFACSHCQNWHISTADRSYSRLMDLSPESAVHHARMGGCQSIAFTYNEPTLSHEYALEVSKLAFKNKIKTVYVTNGYITEDALREIAPVLDAFRVDLKAFSEKFYHSVCKAKLGPVLDSCKLAKELGLHIEIVTLIIPGLNDDPSQLKSMIEWVLHELGPDTPYHFTRFHPDYKMPDGKPTPIEELETIYESAKRLGIHYPYLGNVAGHKYENTCCHKCNNLLIERKGFSTKIKGLLGTKCNNCNEEIPLVIPELSV